MLNKKKQEKSLIVTGDGKPWEKTPIKNNKELILKLFEIEDDSSIVEIFTHLKALYDEEWGDAEATAPPEKPGQVEEKMSKSKSEDINEVPSEESLEVNS